MAAQAKQQKWGLILIEKSGQFCLTSDIDWASEACIEDFLSLVIGFHVRPTIFITHRSAILERFSAKGLLEIGLHPNFRPNSTHGETTLKVAEHVKELYPNARGFRSHSFMDGTPITDAMRGVGMEFDSNLCLYLQVVPPFNHWSGLVRYPVFWEEDVHWTMNGHSWDFMQYESAFRQIGTKVINVHPVHIALNTPNAEFYSSMPVKPSDLTRDDIARYRHAGPGARSFLTTMLSSLTAAGGRFHTLGDLYDATRTGSDQ